MNIYPDNYLYYISFFTGCIFCGTYLLFSYHRNKLLLLNALMFFLVAIRFSTEYYLPEVDSFKVATNIAIFHHLVIALVTFLLKYCAWFYIQPCKGWKWEKLINKFYVWIVLVIPYVFIRGPIIFQRKVFTFQPEKIEGYWRFATDKSDLLYQIRVLHSDFTYYILIAILIWSIYREKNYWFRKTLLFFSFFAVPYLLKKYFYSDLWNTPNVAIFHFANTLLISWFVSDYRLFMDAFDEAKKDLLNSISDFAITTNLGLNITHVNEKARQLFAIKNNQSIIYLLTNFSQLTTFQIKDRLQELLHHSENELELELEVPNIGEKIFSLKAAPFKISTQKIGHTFLLKDLTQIRQKEKELENANAAKDSLFAIISHDLRKPALAFRGISKKVRFLLQQEEFETLDKYGRSLEKAATSLNSLLDNLLKWALQQRDMLPYRPIAINVAEVTEEIMDLFKQMATEKNIHLQADIPEAITAFVDPNAYATIIRNLVDNAIKFTPEGGTIKLIASEQASEVLLKVKDSGVGIAEEKLAKIFELQKQKSTQGTAGEQGTGLGLSLVKDLVLLNKGKIKAQSRWQYGTTFELFFPAI